MVKFERYQLPNGLTVILHKDTATPLVAVNIAYNVGSRDENPQHTGMAHLFEHLMFGGSINIPKYDTPLENAGGENNAFTTTDITDYYLTLPAQNIETALWLESDRMKSLAFSKKSLKNQKDVVVEEFKQSYLNQPYGDAMLLLKPLAYQVHPYQWNTIGKEISHIEKTTMEDVKAFFGTFYCPANAVLSIAGNFDTKKVKYLIEKWFSDIAGGTLYNRNLPQEPPQTAGRFAHTSNKVPVDRLFKAFKMCKRNDKEYYCVDLLSDILSNGKSSRLQKNLIMDKKIFTSASTYLTETVDAGLLIFTGNPADGISLQDADAELTKELDKLSSQMVSDFELEKVKNKMYTILYYNELSIQDKAMNLAIAQTFSDAEDINHEFENYQSVTPENITQQAEKVLNPNVCSTLYYKIRV
ncbi:MAG: insulinase family protein [Bacteroidales bacterium]|jgi:predicted Zn-dependent peptidase|nr:insulinase family protein [Bacteroidales bacterium]